MNFKLIMLPNPILVSDEKIKEGDIIPYVIKWENHYEFFNLNNRIRQSKLSRASKIIAGIEGLPILDLSAIAEEIGWVDLNKIESDYFDEVTKGWDEDSIEHYGHEVRQDAEIYLRGFKAAQSLNEKKFSEEDVKKAILMAWDDSVDTKNMYDIIKSLSKLKEYNVEVEMEYYYMSSKEFYGNDADWIKCSKDNFDSIKREIPSCPLKVEPKITNNTIKVTKIINQI